jgi:L-asparagine transporter-like permease
MAVIANDGFFPRFLGNRIKTHIPNWAIITMSCLAYVLLATGGLQVLLEFGSITFIIVSSIMAYANYKKRHETNSSVYLTVIALVGLLIAGLLIVYFEFTENKEQFVYIISIYAILGIGAFLYSKKTKTNAQQGV